MTTRSKYRSGVLRFYEDVGYENVLPVAPLVHYQDFLGQAGVAIPAAGAAVDGWEYVSKLQGTPTGVAGVANAVGGQVACALAATSEKEEATLYWGDNLGLDVTKGLQFTTLCGRPNTPSTWLRNTQRRRVATPSSPSTSQVNSLLTPTSLVAPTPTRSRGY